MVLIPVIIIIAFAIGPDTIYRESLSTDDGMDEGDWFFNNQTITFSGDLDETDSTLHTIPSQEMSIESINAKLTWSDEDDIRRLRRYENSGDAFSLEMTMDNASIDQRESTNSHGDPGSIEIEYQPTNMTFEAVFEITLVECGNYNAAIGGGFLIIEDTSNSYQLEVTVSYREPIGE
jgi:hypothetical protein